MIKKVIVVFVLGIILFSCSEEKQKEENKSEGDAGKKEMPVQEKDARQEAVLLNDQLSLNHAHAFVLIDSLLKIPNLSDMSAQIPEVQVELVAIRHRVNDMHSELEEANNCKQAVLNQ